MVGRWLGTAIGLAALAAAGGAAAQVRAEGAACNKPPVLRCPDEGCPSELIGNPGPVVDPATGRKFFLDYPCDLKPGEKVTVVLNLHGGGSYGNWQRHYFPIADYVDKYRLVVATPNAPPRVWRETDDAHLQNVVSYVEQQFGKDNIRAFWLAGHSQGGSTSRRIVCSPFFQPRVTGFLSLSGGRVGGAPERASGAGRPAQRAADGSPPARPASAAANQPRPPQPAEPACDFSHIYAIGEHEIGALPATSARAERYGCKARVRRPDIADTKKGYIYDSTAQNPSSKAWGGLPKPGVAQVWEYPDCRDGRVVADVVRIDKGHTEGLEPKVTESLVRLMTAAR